MWHAEIESLRSREHLLEVRNDPRGCFSRVSRHERSPDTPPRGLDIPAFGIMMAGAPAAWNLARSADIHGEAKSADCAEDQADLQRRLPAFQVHDPVARGPDPVSECLLRDGALLARAAQEQTEFFRVPDVQSNPLAMRC